MAANITSGSDASQIGCEESSGSPVIIERFLKRVAKFNASVFKRLTFKIMQSIMEHNTFSFCPDFYQQKDSIDT
jgi:hypothetical protein